MIYFDNAATGFPKSPGVIDAVGAAMKRCGNPGRGGHAPSMYAAEILYECREEAASFFGTTPERVILTPSATTALNMAIKGFALNKVVTSSMEHNAVLRPLHSMARREEITLSFFDVPPRDDAVVLGFTKALEGAYTAAFIHASNVNGRILPLKRLTEKAREKGVVTIVDAAQSAGHVRISVTDAQADIVCVAGHKGLYGPLGTGAMLLNPKFDMPSLTLLEGGTGIRSHDLDMPPEYPERFEPGTVNAPAFAGLTAALRETKKEGFGDERVFQKLLEGLDAIQEITLAGAPGPEGSYAPVLLFNVREKSCDEVMTALLKQGICVRSGFHCASLAHQTLGTKTGGVRVSVGRKNTLKEAETFLKAIRRIAKDP